MKLLIALGCFIPLFARSQNKATNQNLYDTVPNMPEHYENRVKLFENEKIVTGKIIFLGNSITEMGPWHKLLNDSAVINRGIGGDVTFGVLRRLDDIINRKPSKLFIMIGINDIGKDIPVTVIAANYRKIIERISKESPATEIYIQSILPVNSSYPFFPQHYDKLEYVIKTNKLLKDLAAEKHIRFINLFPLFLDKKGKLDYQYTTDGLHLNEKGYMLWVNYLKKEKLI
ncbi:MAG: sialate O-acetylesterase [Cytophagaceae bacterium]|nr:sialate O-acetylesterase [Cytophagaceae bacterium]